MTLALAKKVRKIRLIDGAFCIMCACGNYARFRLIPAHIYTCPHCGTKWQSGNAGSDGGGPAVMIEI